MLRSKFFMASAGVVLAMIPAAIPALAQGASAGLVFSPLAPCVIFDSAEAGLRLGPERVALRSVEALPSSGVSDAENLASCSPAVWDHARAALLRVEVDFATASGSLKIWAGGPEAEPASGLLAVAPPQVGQGLVLVDLCPAGEKAGEPCSDLLWSRLEGAEAEVKLELVGIFLAPAVAGPVAASGGEIEAATSALVAPFWVENANGVHFNEGNVGIGTDLPERLLQVGSWATGDTQYLFGSDSISMQGIEGKDRLPYLEMRGEDGTRAFYLGWGSKANKVVDWKFENNYKLSIQANRMGIGTTTPESRLDVNGALSVSNVAPDDSTPANATLNFFSREAGGSKHRWALHSASVGGGFGVLPNSLTVWEYDGRSCTSPDPVCHPRMVFEPNTGNVGIGVQDPQARLHVAGDIKIDGRLISNGDICIGTCP